MRQIRTLLWLASLTTIGCGGEDPTKWAFEPFSITVVDSTFTVPAGNIEAFFVDVRVDAYIRNIVLDGQFQVTDGGDKDIQVFVMRDFGFGAFLSGEPFLALYGTDHVSAGTFLLPIVSTDRYHVVFSNRFSTAADKTVKATVVITWEEQVSATPGQ